ncbi:adenylosuccinate synthetase [Rasiella rasia]|uniref:Adenylosuccinate synthetase n=2 Tax=Rasiella rasia TaxID=2744027 RepID=A0A6G6GQH6_9FLAO|nr:adenylosuccinate synthetase [Rasiella rasia]
MFLVAFTTTNAQIPSEVPGPDDNPPIDLSNTADILIYIVLPIIILLLLLFRIKKNKK